MFSADVMAVLAAAYLFLFFTIYLRLPRGKTFVYDYLEFVRFNDFLGIRLMRRHWPVPVFTILIPALVILSLNLSWGN